MDSEAARRARADERRKRATIRRGSLERDEQELHSIAGAEAISLVTRLTLESWSLSGREIPTYDRASTPFRFVRGRGS